jgi:hypothetical protein
VSDVSIRKKCAAAVAAVLPLTAFGILGATSTASATAPPAAVVCTNLAPDASPPAGGLGGTSFDNSASNATPGSNGVFLGSNPGTATSHSVVTLLKQVNKGATSAEFTTKAGSAVAVGDQTFKIAGSGLTYTVLSGSTPLGKAFPDIVTFTPALSPTSKTATFLKAGSVVTINDTSGSVNNHVVNTTAETNNSNQLVGGFNSTDIGQEINVSYLNNGLWHNALGFTASATASSTGGSLSGGLTAAGVQYNYEVVVMHGGGPVAWEGVSATVANGVTTGSVTVSWTLDAAMQAAGYTVNVFGRSLLPNDLGLLSDGTGLSPTGSYTDTGSGTPGASVETAMSGSPLQAKVVSVAGSTATLSENITGLTEPSGSVVAAVGSTNVSPSAVYTDSDYTLFGGAGGNGNGSCFTDLGNSLGSFAPVSGRFIGASTVARPNAAIGLEQNPAPMAGTITWPPMTSTGWLDDNGQVAPANPLTTSFSFPNAKYDLFVLTQNAYTFAKGNTTGEYKLTGSAAVGFAASGMVTCSIAQLEAINSNTGPDSVSTSPYFISSAQASGPEPEYNYCDGGPNNVSGVSPSQALNNLITLELSPTASVYASDGSPLSAIWWILAGPEHNAVF